MMERLQRVSSNRKSGFGDELSGTNNNLPVNAMIVRCEGKSWVSAGLTLGWRHLVSSPSGSHSQAEVQLGLKGRCWSLARYRFGPR